jgi:hypothetical protein
VNSSLISGDYLVAGFVSLNMGYISQSNTYSRVRVTEAVAGGFAAVNLSIFDFSGFEDLINENTILRRSSNIKIPKPKYLRGKNRKKVGLSDILKVANNSEKSIINCISGLSSAIVNCYAKGNVAGGAITGGFVAVNVDLTDLISELDYSINNDISFSSIQECFSTGRVSGYFAVGGFCGGNIAGTITNCYSTGNATGIEVPDFGDEGDESFLEYTYVGGFCGFSEENSIDYCYSTGSASGSGVNGGFLGYNGSSSFTCCYWNTSNNSEFVGGVGEGGNEHTNSEINGLTSAQFSDAGLLSCLIDENPGIWVITENGPILNGTTLPTLTEWAVIVFIGLLAGVGGWFVWRRMT